MKSSLIMVVDDQEFDRVLIARAMKKSNNLNEIIAMDSCEAAQDYMSNFDNELPALILLDLSFPGGKSGLDLLQWIRGNSHTHLIRVVILTISADQEEKLKSYELGASSFIRKPLEINQFLDAIRQIGLYWLVLNDTPTGDKQ